ncbi:hypothetical protein G6F46_014477 [Rhizopus delemar]|nr:hypothetical protein G6F46_014477 [Rhizopus delemar]
MPPSTGVIHARSPYRHPLAGPVASAVLGAADRARPEPGNQWAGSEQRGGGDLEGAAGGNPPFRGRVQRGARRLRGSAPTSTRKTRRPSTSRPTALTRASAWNCSSSRTTPA